MSGALQEYLENGRQIAALMDRQKAIRKALLVACGFKSQQEPGLVFQESQDGSTIGVRVSPAVDPLDKAAAPKDVNVEVIRFSDPVHLDV